MAHFLRGQATGGTDCTQRLIGTQLRKRHHYPEFVETTGRIHEPSRALLAIGLGAATPMVPFHT